MNLLIPYKYLPGHEDPLFSEFTYGDINARARKLRNCISKGDYIFFHTGFGGNKQITAYYIIDFVIDTQEAVKRNEIVERYNSPHIRRALSGEKMSSDDVLIFGDPFQSKILEKPLLFNKGIADNLSLNIKFPSHRTENQAIVSSTRQWRELSKDDVRYLLQAIELVESGKLPPNARKTEEENSKGTEIKSYERPEWLQGLINHVEKLKGDKDHQERAHESLVEIFYDILGFAKFDDIKHRQGRIDITIECDKKKMVVNEVKRDWYLTRKNKKALNQAFNYALENGTRYVVLTNGDYYAIFDRARGMSYEEYFLGEFKLTELDGNGLKLIETLRKDRLSTI